MSDQSVNSLSMDKTKLCANSDPLSTNQNGNSHCYSSTRSNKSIYAELFYESSSNLPMKTGPLFVLGVIIVLFLTVLKEAQTAVNFDYVPRPEFVEKASDLNVTSYIDQTTRLPCTVRHLGTKRVSWIRGRDLQVLSSGRTTFASDIRISILPGTKQSKRLNKRSTHINSYKKHILSRDYSSPVLRTKRQYYEDLSPSSSNQHSRWIQIGNKSPKRSQETFKYDQPHLYNYSDVPQRFTSGLNYNDVFFNYALANSYRNLKNDTMFFKGNLNNNDAGYDNVAAPTKSSISIHPSSTNVAQPDAANARKRTLVPYNYLDEIWEPEDFTLQIKYTKPSDAGTYICQINTEPRMTQVIRLKVIDMVARIAGPKELFVKEESPVLLICKVTHGANLPGFIFWFKNDQLVDYDSSDGRIKVDTTPNGRSKLLLKKAVREDSANYTCAPAGGNSDSTVLTVIIDERPAAMQKGCASYLHSSFLLMGSVLCTLIVSNENILLYINAFLCSQCFLSDLYTIT